MTEWKAELPEVHESRVANCDAMDVNTLVTRANEELAKVRAERDAALEKLRGLTTWHSMDSAPRCGRWFLARHRDGLPLVVQRASTSLFGDCWLARCNDQGAGAFLHDDALTGWREAP